MGTGEGGGWGEKGGCLARGGVHRRRIGAPPASPLGLPPPLCSARGGFAASLCLPCPRLPSFLLLLLLSRSLCLLVGGQKRDPRGLSSPPLARDARLAGAQPALPRSSPAASPGSSCEARQGEGGGGGGGEQRHPGGEGEGEKGSRERGKAAGRRWQVALLSPSRPPGAVPRLARQDRSSAAPPSDPGASRRRCCCCCRGRGCCGRLRCRHCRCRCWEGGWPGPLPLLGASEAGVEGGREAGGVQEAAEEAEALLRTRGGPAARSEAARRGRPCRRGASGAPAGRGARRVEALRGSRGCCAARPPSPSPPPLLPSPGLLLLLPLLLLLLLLLPPPPPPRCCSLSPACLPAWPPASVARGEIQRRAPSPSDGGDFARETDPQPSARALQGHHGEGDAEEAEEAAAVTRRGEGNKEQARDPK